MQKRQAVGQRTHGASNQKEDEKVNIVYIIDHYVLIICILLSSLSVLWLWYTSSIAIRITIMMTIFTFVFFRFPVIYFFIISFFRIFVGRFQSLGIRDYGWGRRKLRKVNGFTIHLMLFIICVPAWAPLTACCTMYLRPWIPACAHYNLCPIAAVSVAEWVGL